MTHATTTDNIVDLMQEDHEKVKALFTHVLGLQPEQREEPFYSLVADLVRHEVAEEVVVYPLIRSKAPDGGNETAARLEEQTQAEQKLARMERMDFDSAEFTSALTSLRDAVLAHAQAEERNIFPLLRALEDEDSLSELGVRYNKAKATAPTHPHPHAPDTPPGNTVMGPIAAIFDRARDAVRNI